METLIFVLLLGGLAFLMMRGGGCGSHGHAGHGGHTPNREPDDQGSTSDPAIPATLGGSADGTSLAAVEPFTLQGYRIGRIVFLPAAGSNNAPVSANGR